MHALEWTAPVKRFGADSPTIGMLLLIAGTVDENLPTILIDGRGAEPPLVR